jgi:DNA-binding NtrC family response regulator
VPNRTARWTGELHLNSYLRGTVLPVDWEIFFHLRPVPRSYFFLFPGKTSGNCCKSGSEIAVKPSPSINLPDSGTVAGFGTRIAIDGVTQGLNMPGAIMTQNGKRRDVPHASYEARTRRTVSLIAESESPVLIVGERGTGKRSVALEIHGHSSRARGPFREIHSGESTADTLQAALTGRGTVYLAEVGNLSLPLQELIVHLISGPAHAGQCRLLCGSSHELMPDVEAWRMSEEFYYLISAITLRIPPLRCRKSEILVIADELLTKYSKQFDRPKPDLGEEIVGMLLEHHWPENLSELQTAIKTFVAIGDQAISLAAIRAASPARRANGARRIPSLKEATRASSILIERQLISEVLVGTGGNRKRAAAELGISYKALLYKLKRIEAERQHGSRRNGVTQ